MSFGKITIKDENTGSFSFINKDGIEEQHDFIIAKIEKKDKEAKEAFSKFGGVKTPYKKGKYEKTLEIIDSMFKHAENIKGYTETILLHELHDHDDNENSMIESEIYVIDVIQKSELSKDEKRALIESHLGFFNSNKGFYEGIFETYKKWFEEHIKEYEEMKNHYHKICNVITYIEGIVTTEEKNSDK